MKRLLASFRPSDLFTLYVVVALALPAASSFLQKCSHHSKSSNEDRASRNKRKEAALLESTHRSQRAVLSFVTNLRSQFANPPPIPSQPDARRDHFLNLARLMKEALPPDLPDDLADPWRDLTAAAAYLADSTDLPAPPLPAPTPPPVSTPPSPHAASRISVSNNPHQTVRRARAACARNASSLSTVNRPP